MKRGLIAFAVNYMAVSLFAEAIVTNRLYDGSILYTFNSSGEVEISSKGWIDVLAVGGGGAGGGYAGGGGGGGAVVQRNAIRVEKGTCLEAVVGLGGGKMPDSSGVYGQGQDSAIPALGIVAAGGGAGGGYHGATPDTAEEFAARSGGAGGGARAFKDQNNLSALDRPEILAGAVSIIETGFAGGSRMLYAAGGGGGAGARGGDAFLDSEDGLWAGKGGDGIVSDITGDPVYYGGGGGGGARVDPRYWYNTNGIDYVSSMGGLGGGGMGRRGEANAGVSGVDGLGGGGGGGGGNYHVASGDGRLGGHGGDGVVIIRFTPERFDNAEYPGVASITYEDDGSVLYTFTETGIFSPPCEGTADVLLVGGGGGGGYFNGGGGSGGQVLYREGLHIDVRDYVVGVGGGGAGAVEGRAATSGGVTSAFRIKALGGMPGGSSEYYKLLGAGGDSPNGFSGGKAYAELNENGNIINGTGRGGGGAGAGGNGVSAAAGLAPDGGAGVINYITGKGVVYAGGGGGGSSEMRTNKSFGLGGSGIGGEGGFWHSGDNQCASNGLDGAAFTGSGGGGGGGYYHIQGGNGGNGGSGVAIIRFRPIYEEKADVRPTVTGGKTVVSSGEAVSTFTSDGVITFHQNLIVEFLLVGGGGAGGAYAGGGGGGGGVVHVSQARLLAGTYNITVGRGGVPVWMKEHSARANGTVSSFGKWQALGGGAGGTGSGVASGANSQYSSCGFMACSGANGGGAPAYTESNTYDPQRSFSGALPIDASGFAGGASSHPAAGGGAGAGEKGGDAIHSGDTDSSGYAPGCGGAGVLCEITGEPLYYGGGGGGGARMAGSSPSPAATGGLGGGGAGALGSTGSSADKQPCGKPGVDGLGGGGGGGAGLYHIPPNFGDGYGLGGRGGDGIVIIRYKVVPVGMRLILK